jgi:hypothetical protein
MYPIWPYAITVSMTGEYYMFNSVCLKKMMRIYNGGEMHG